MPKRIGLAIVVLVSTLVLRLERAGAAEPLAVVDGEVITADEVEAAIAPQLHRLEEQMYRLKRQKLEALITDRLLAREASRRNLTVAALIDAEVTAKAAPVTEEDVENFRQANKERLRGDDARQRERIRSHLQQRNLIAQREAFVQSLRSRAKVVVHLPAPPIFRAAVSGEGDRTRGGAGAPVTIVEFSDFECPFCKRAQPVLTQVLARYGNRVKLIYRDFPLEREHPLARPAAEAARCAHDQGKFWNYHDLLYANAPKLTPADLRGYAQNVGLDLGAFEQCLTSRRHSAAIDRDVDEGRHLGVDGTPGFFINGRPLRGAQPLEVFVGIIDEELARTH